MTFELDCFYLIFSYGLGIVNYKKKRYDRSISFLNLAKNINPFNFNIKCYCSIVLESLGQRSEALEVLSGENKCLSSVIYYRKAKLYDSMNLSRVFQFLNLWTLLILMIIGSRTSFTRGHKKLSE